ncbi:MAG: aminoacyl-tRNA hydrolase [Pleomorphochaeta sp.]
MKLILGLGNPGSEYKETRHNCGFKVIELCAAFFHVNMKKRCFRLYQRAKLKKEDNDYLLIKPLTYMNNSGNILKNFKNIKTEDIIVICDQMDLPLSYIRIKKGGGDAGHNGLKSIIKNLDGERNFIRIYVGINRPKSNESIVDHVLGVEENKELFNQGIEKANNALIDIINNVPIEKVMQKYNVKIK